MAKAPGVMVSSTFYDLRQVRADLAQFIERELGYRAILSEFQSFPVDPDVDTIENCRRRVERDADILILIIGGRYGFVDADTSKSVTNLEYLSARAKGIPIYAFVDKQVLAVLPVWEKNPQADFSSIVSDTRVFQFIQQVRSTDSVWTYGFDLVQEITSTLRTQFAYLVSEGLEWRQRLGDSQASPLKDLRGKALRLALERPESWEPRLFLQVLADEVHTYASLRREHRYHLAFGSGDHIALADTPNWLAARMRELERLSVGFNRLMNETLQEAFGPPGKPGDVAGLVFVGRQVGAVYRHAIEWAQNLRRAHVDECFQLVIQESAAYTDNMISSIENFAPDALQRFDEALSELQSGGTPAPLNLTLTIDIDNVAQFEEAVRKAERDCFGRKRWLF